MINLTSSQLRQAADLQEQIEALKQQLAGLLGVQSPAPVQAAELAEETVKPAKRTMSPAHKAAIRAAQALRWAKHNAEKGKPAKTELKPPKRKLSAAGRAAIIAATKARWAKIRAAKEKK